MHEVTYHEAEREKGLRETGAVRARRYGEALCLKLQQLRGRWQADRREWVQKPMVFASQLGGLADAQKVYLDNPCKTSAPKGRQKMHAGC